MELTDITYFQILSDLKKNMNLSNVSEVEDLAEEYNQTISDFIEQHLGEKSKFYYTFILDD